MLAFNNPNAGRNPSMASASVFFSSGPSALSDKELRATVSMNSINRSAPSFGLSFFQSSILGSPKNDFVIACIRVHQEGRKETERCTLGLSGANHLAVRLRRFEPHNIIRIAWLNNIGQPRGPKLESPTLFVAI